MHLDKLLRLISEVQQCKNGDREAFHLLIFVKSLLLPQSYDNPLGPEYDAPIPRDEERVDDEVMELIRKSNAAAVQKHTPAGRIFFDFASAARLMFGSLPRNCRICHRPPPPQPPRFPDPFAGLFPEPPCARTPYLRLLQTVQQWAHGEILSGIMLTLSPRLPKELCLLVFEYALEAEGQPSNPCVWEADDYLVGMRICGALKERYICRKPEPWENTGW